jgi:hypothetical protein
MSKIGKDMGLRPREQRTGADAYFWPERRGKPIRAGKRGKRGERVDRSPGEMLLWLLGIIIALIIIDAWFFNGQYMRHIEAQLNATSESWRAASNGVWGAH